MQLYSQQEHGWKYIIKIYGIGCYLLQIYCVGMAQLDVSMHSLNLSASKQKYSFPKSKRFQSKDNPLCDQLYSIPSSFSKRSTMLGYGNKSLGLKDSRFIPGVGTYNSQSDINPQKNMRRSISFGVSRQNMELGGPLGHVKKFLEKLPAPGTYQAKNTRDFRAPLLRSRLPDHQFQKFIKNPGPGTYNHEQFGKNNYYLSSKFKNQTNVKISQVSRLQPISSKKVRVGPTDYNPIDNFNPAGRYSLAKHTSTNSCIFQRSQRKGIQQEGVIRNPGPGSYNSFSGFG